MGNLKLLGIAVLIAAAGYSVGRYIQPPKVEEKEVIKEVVKEVKDEHTVTRVVERPDGTKETIIDNTSKTRTDTALDKTTDKTSTLRPDWKIAAGVGLDKDKAQYYILEVNRRILGGISVGVIGTTQKSVGVTVGLEF